MSFQGSDKDFGKKKENADRDERSKKVRFNSYAALSVRFFLVFG